VCKKHLSSVFLCFRPGEVQQLKTDGAVSEQRRQQEYCLTIPRCRWTSNITYLIIYTGQLGIELHDLHQSDSQERWLRESSATSGE